MELIVGILLADKLSEPAQRLIAEVRDAVNMVMSLTGLDKEQAQLVVQKSLDIAYEAINMCYDIKEEHPDWTEEQVKAEAIRRGPKNVG